VVCTPLPSLAEVVQDGKHGLYVPERDPQALADTMEALARNPELCRAMGVAGRRKIEELFDSEKNVDVLVSLFRAGRREHGASAEAVNLTPNSPAQVRSMACHTMPDPLRSLRN
jgi:hypothetical protein